MRVVVAVGVGGRGVVGVGVEWAWMVDSKWWIWHEIWMDEEMNLTN